MGSSPAPQTQSTTYQLSPEQRELMNLAMPGVTQFAASTPQRYQGSTIAGFNQNQTGGQQGALDAAHTQTALANAGAGASASWLNPNTLDVSNSPIVQNNIAAATRPINEQLMQVALPGIRDAATSTGNFGSSRQGIAEGVAIGKAANATKDATTGVVNNAYNQAVEAQLKTLGLLPSTVGTLPQGALTTSAVGDTQQALDQARLSEVVGNFNFDNNANYLKSKDIMSLLTGLPGGTTTSTASTPQKNPLTSALGGAASGASLGSFLGPAGSGIGAGLGALLGFL